MYKINKYIFECRNMMIILKQTTINQLKKILMINFTWCVTLIIANVSRVLFFRSLKKVIALLLLSNLNLNSALVRTVQNRPQIYSFNCTVIKCLCFSDVTRTIYTCRKCGYIESTNGHFLSSLLLKSF